jgi:UDP-N-acetylglucosamine transferase subunit ALG13
VIFLTLGTQAPFDRLVKAVDLWCEAHPQAEVFGQITDPGANGYRPKHFEWVAWLTPAEYGVRFRQASLIVAHAGMGSIITALTDGKPIAILPRRAYLGEQRNEHQLATAKRFAGKPGVYVAETEADLPAALDRARTGAGQRSGGRIGAFAEPQLTAALRAFVRGEPQQ